MTDTFTSDPDEDYYWLSDADKLRLLADWLDVQDEGQYEDDTPPEVQDDLRRMAWEMEKGEGPDSGEGFVFWLFIGIGLFLLALFFVGL